MDESRSIQVSRMAMCVQNRMAWFHRRLPFGAEGPGTGFARDSVLGVEEAEEDGSERE